MTNPMKKGRTKSVVFENFEYKGDDYNAKKALMNKELKAHHDTMDKMLGDEFKPFSQRAERPKSVSYTHLTLPTTPYV